MSLTLQCRYRKPIEGTVRVPSDKSLSHRALICAALAYGESHIYSLLESEDVLATERALREGFGVAIREGSKGNVRIVRARVATGDNPKGCWIWAIQAPRCVCSSVRLPAKTYVPRLMAMPHYEQGPCNESQSPSPVAAHNFSGTTSHTICP